MCVHTGSGAAIAQLFIWSLPLIVINKYDDVISLTLVVRVRTQKEEREGEEEKESAKGKNCPLPAPKTLKL